MYEYPIEAYQEAGSWWSKCPDIPEAHSAGSTLEELLLNAVEGLTLALSIYVDQGRAIPRGSVAKTGQHLIRLPAQVIAKIVLWNRMLELGMRVADLARKLELSHPVATRLVDFEHKSKIEQIEGALKALGAKLLVQPIDPAATTIHFRRAFDKRGDPVILVNLPSVRLDELRSDIFEMFKGIEPQESVANIDDYASRWWLQPIDATNLKTQGWSLFSFTSK